MARRKKAKEADPPQGEDDLPATSAAQEAVGTEAEELRRWMAGESTLMAWLEEDPSQQTTFYSDTPDLLDLDPDLKERIAQYEAEIAQLRQLTTSGGATEGSAVSEEVVRLKAEVNRLSKANSELRDRAVASAPESLKDREATLRDKENDLEMRERALGMNGAESGIIVERYRAELSEKEAEAKAREEEMRNRIQQLEADLRTREIEIKLRDDELKLAKMSKPEANKEISEKLKGFQEKEKRILELQETVGRMKDLLTEREDELKGLKEIIGYKEQELSRREEDLLFREKKATEEKRRLEEAKKSAGGLEEAELKKRLEELRGEVEKKERDLKAKEEFIRGKEAELRKREMGAIEEELKHKDEDIALETETAKAKTGNPRLDDLLLGGVPFGSNVLVHGPPFVGKETMVDQFIAEGLKKGIPAIWVTTDKTPADLREEMKLVLPAYEDYEALGLVKYIDSYSRGMGDTTVDKYTTYIDEPTAHDRIMDAVEDASKTFKEKSEYYRLAFRTLSTLIAYSDPASTFRFLTPFCGRRKRDHAVSFYTIEKGMHGEQEIQMLGSIMDGMIDFKIDQLRTLFMVRGITDVQSRSYIRYNATRHGLSIGSFALDHIK
ncbi:MAG: ATPase domain-containing protein [Methanomassiliicoccus sp.]|nr:ATPase domain-containing protein [Methanomassiliicoccus sp.]